MTDPDLDRALAFADDAYAHSGVLTIDERTQLAVLAAEVKRLQARRCETCQHWDECGEDGQGMCEFFGVHTRTDFACNAWEAK